MSAYRNNPSLQRSLYPIDAKMKAQNRADALCELRESLEAACRPAVSRRRIITGHARLRVARELHNQRGGQVMEKRHVGYRVYISGPGCNTRSVDFKLREHERAKQVANAAGTKVRKVMRLFWQIAGATYVAVREMGDNHVVNCMAMRNRQLNTLDGLGHSHPSGSFESRLPQVQARRDEYMRDIRVFQKELRRRADAGITVPETQQTSKTRLDGYMGMLDDDDYMGMLDDDDRPLG